MSDLVCPNILLWASYGKNSQGWQYMCKVLCKKPGNKQPPNKLKLMLFSRGLNTLGSFMIIFSLNSLMILPSLSSLMILPSLSSLMILPSLSSLMILPSLSSLMILPSQSSLMILNNKRKKDLCRRKSFQLLLVLGWIIAKSNNLNFV